MADQGSYYAWKTLQQQTFFLRAVASAPTPTREGAGVMPIAMHHAVMARWASVILPYRHMGRWESVKIMQLMKEGHAYGFVSVTCTQQHK